MTHTPLHAHAGTSLNRIVRLTRSVSCALLFGFFLLISVSSALGQTAGGPIDPSIKELLNTYEHKIYFTENRGQFKERVLYRADFPYGQAAATAEGMYISTYDPASVQARMDDGELLEREIQNGQRIRPLNGRLKGHTWLMNFVGRSAGMTTSGAERHGDFYNYFTGNTSRHATGVANYQEVWYNNVYNNVDVRYYPAEDGTLEYDIVCKPGFRPTDIRIRFDGIDRLKVKEDGGLLFETSVGSVEFPAPVVYQQINGARKTIAAAYRVRENNMLSFELGEYDVNAPMIIDPIALRWATWVNTASSGDNHGHCIWVDPSDGAIYMVARVVGTTDQITIGAFDELANGNLEMIVGKYLEPVNIGEAGTRVWQTYIGGNNDDNPYAMEQGPDGNLYITGYTGSTNFPLLGGTGFSGSSIDNQSQSGNDIFILKINRDGTGIKASVLGGNGDEGSYDLRINEAGDVVICGQTTSTNLSTLYGLGASNTNNGSNDWLVFKINQDLSALAWMKNNGGSGSDIATIMVQNVANGDLFIGGSTASTNFPTLNPRQSTRGGSSAGFIQKMNAVGNLQWASYFSSATSQSASILCMEFNTSKNQLYFGGLTTGLNAANISASGVIDNSVNGGNDFFVCRMDTNQTFVAGTYLGGSGTEENMMGLNTDLNNDVYIFGYSSSTNFPVSSSPNVPLQSTNQGSSDKTFSKISSSLSTLLFSTYYGGTSNDYDPVGERGIKFSNCRIYTIVTARSNNIPLTVGALNTTKTSTTSIYEPGMVIWANPPDLLGNSITGNQTICAGTIPGDLTGSEPAYVLPTITRAGSTSSYPSLGAATTYQWQISTDSTNWSDIPGATSRDLPGTTIGALYQKTFFRRIIGGDACILAGAADQVVTVKIVTASGTVTDAACNGTATGSISATSDGESPFTYAWSNGQSSQTAINLAAGTYTVTITDNGNCTATTSFTVGEPDALDATASTTTANCSSNTGGASVTVTGGTQPYSYLWSNGASGSSISNVAGGSYSVTITDANSCTFTLPVTIPTTSIPDVNAGLDQTLTCSNASITLTATSSTPGATFAWTGGPNGASKTVTAAGTYSVTATDPASGCTASDEVIISQDIATPNVDAGTDQSLSCTITSATLTATSSTPGVTFDWVGGPSGASKTVTAAGVYTVIATNPDNGCTASDIVSVSQDISTPNVNAGADQTLTCGNTSITLTATSSTAGATFEWAGGPSGASKTVTAAGTYTVVATNPANGCTASDEVTINQDNAVPNVNAGADQTLTCTLTSITLTASSSTAGATFEWVGGPSGASKTVTAAGTYTVVATNPANGCTASDEVVVDQDIVAPGGSVVGSDETLTCTTTSITLIALSNIADATFEWVGGPSGESKTVTAAGTYTVVATNPANGCTASFTFSVGQDITQPDVNAGADQTLTCSTTSITLTATSSTSGATFEWVGGPSGAGKTVSAAGTYTVVATNPANGCTASDEVTVSQDANLPNVNAGADQTLTCTTTSITLTATSSTAGATFEWVGGPSGASKTVTAAGTYTVVATNPANGCTASDEVVVDQDIVAPGGSVVGSDETLTCTTTSITLIALSNIADATFEWVGGPSGESKTVTAAGTYTVVATNPANGCTASFTFSVGQDNTQPDVNAGADQTLTCSTTSITLTATSSTSGATFEWVGGPSGAGKTVSAAGTYTVVATNPANGCTASDEVTVSQDANLPNVNAGADQTLTCTTTSITLTATSSTAGATFEWVGGPSGATKTVSAAGTYTVIATNPANGCTASDEVVIGQDGNLPDVNAGADQSLSCTTTSITLTATSSTAGATFAWVGGPSGASKTVTAAGTYTVVATNPANGCTASDEVVIGQDINTPIVNAGVDQSLTCTTTSITLTATSSTAGATFAWVGGPSGASKTVTAAGTYTVVATDPANGCTASDEVVIGLNNNVPNANAGPDLTVGCGSGTVTLQGSSTTAGVDFSWTASNGGHIVSGGGSASPLVDEAGTYTVVVTNPTNGCTASDFMIVTETQLPNCNISGNETICQGQSTNLCVGGGYASYQWSTGATTSCISVSQAGTYTVTVTNSDGCTSSCSKTVTVTGSTNCLISGNLNICQGQTTQLCAPAGYSSYLWSNGATTQCITVNCSGNYSVTVSNGSCTSSCSVCVTVRPRPSVCITGCTRICQGQTTSLCASSGYSSYQWSNGATTRCINVSAPGTYSVVVTNGSGCTASASTTVTVGSAPSCNISGNTTICQGSSTTLCGPSGNYSYYWSNGSRNRCITVNCAGTYTLTVSNGSCSSTCSVTVTVSSAPSATITGNLRICGGQTTSLCAPSGTGYTYRWNTGSTSRCITVGTPGNYTVTVTNAAGCTRSSTVCVTSSPGISCNITGNTTICQGSSTSLCGPSSCASYRWSTGATTRCINVSTAGTYTLTVTNSGGCSSTCTATVTVAPRPSSTITGPTVIRQGCPISLCAPSGGASYRWNTGATTRCITVNCAGTYSVTVTNAAGCSSTSSICVTWYQRHHCRTVVDPKTGGVTAEVTGGIPPYTFAWSNDATESSDHTTVKHSGTVEVTVTDAEGSVVKATADVLLDLLSVSAYPNPVSERATIEFTNEGLSDKAVVSIYTLDGSLVTELYNDEAMSKHLYRVTWDAADIVPGVYVYRIVCGSKSFEGKLTVQH
ncbi:T9SS type A sorting domain-containing protein [Candidatus Pollutiaquabacter sp.]|uniref:DUF7948 domain-containing protein n=1 Tax=Candidatus Pollutiaquabacter sp. TaxID=3416354 RepID=UPI003CC4AD95|nr:T9SS type A sorting domain-containing protein [Bacteroidota bacterium]